ncbi:hypothetical protein IC232_03445 [Microvirga sp. BT688]|uniref:helix-turn-helix domain-containing protein n=1 Tax=Microvirga sp. TaxID=1873136 RepID=UPI001688F57E|nr:helix-turn-helix transcriptional regulator [Microvirga sp.]MBD2745744.1 hypothetical protein [Microvirga sp.]
MSRQSFSEDDFSESMTLQNVSANLETIKRMKGWSVTEMSKHIGISDRHLDSLLKMTSNVTVLVLEKIADGLGIPFLRLVGTRIVVKGHQAGADFLRELRKETWEISSEDAPAPPVRPSKAVDTRKGAKVARASEAAEAPTGLEGILQRIVEVQDRLAQDNSQTNAKVDRLSTQVENLVSAVKGGSGEAASGAGAKRGPKGPRKARTERDSATASTGKGGRGGAARSVAGATSSVTGEASSAKDAEGDLFDRSAPAPAKRRGRPPNAERTSESGREAALKSRGTESVKKSKAPKGAGAPKRAYNGKK